MRFFLVVRLPPPDEPDVGYSLFAPESPLSNLSPGGGEAKITKQSIPLWGRVRERVCADGTISVRV